MIIRDFYFAAWLIERGYTYHFTDKLLSVNIDKSTFIQLKREYDATVMPYFKSIRKIIKSINNHRDQIQGGGNLMAIITRENIYNSTDITNLYRIQALLTDKLAQEIACRISGDLENSSAVVAEATIAREAEAALNITITNEITNRIAAETLKDNLMKQIGNMLIQ